VEVCNTLGDEGCTTPGADSRPQTPATSEIASEDESDIDDYEKWGIEDNSEKGKHGTRCGDLSFHSWRRNTETKKNDSPRRRGQRRGQVGLDSDDDDGGDDETEVESDIKWKRSRREDKDAEEGDEYGRCSPSPRFSNRTVGWRMQRSPHLLKKTKHVEVIVDIPCVLTTETEDTTHGVDDNEEEKGGQELSLVKARLNETEQKHQDKKEPVADNVLYSVDESLMEAAYAKLDHFTDKTFGNILPDHSQFRRSCDSVLGGIRIGNLCSSFVKPRIPIGFCCVPECKNRIKRRGYCHKHLHSILYSTVNGHRALSDENRKQHNLLVFPGKKKNKNKASRKINKEKAANTAHHPARCNNLRIDRATCSFIYNTILAEQKGEQFNTTQLKKCPNKVVYVKMGLCKRHASEVRKNLNYQSEYIEVT